MNITKEEIDSQIQRKKLVVTSGEGEGEGTNRRRGLRDTTMYKINKLQGYFIQHRE